MSHCFFCANGRLTIPDHEYYEAILFMHNVIADQNFRQFIIEIDVLEQTLKFPENYYSTQLCPKELKKLIASVEDGKKLIDDRKKYLTACFFEAINKFNPDKRINYE